jgi:hypothetical protein
MPGDKNKSVGAMRARVLRNAKKVTIINNGQKFE